MNDMKVDFKRNFKDFRGEETDISIREKVAESLFVAGSSSECRVENKDKYTAYKLSVKIAREGIVEITTEEASLIKSVTVNFFAAGAYGQIEELIEGGVNIG
jgi:hypothetical protein